MVLNLRSLGIFLVLLEQNSNFFFTTCTFFWEEGSVRYTQTCVLPSINYKYQMKWETIKEILFIPYTIFCINLFQSTLKVYSSAHDTIKHKPRHTTTVQKISINQYEYTKQKYYCAVGESNPGPSRGRRRLYHLTNRAVLILSVLQMAKMFTF
jgi:hypothetical protein